MLERDWDRLLHLVRHVAAHTPGQALRTARVEALLGRYAMQIKYNSPEVQSRTQTVLKTFVGVRAAAALVTAPVDPAAGSESS